MESPCKAHTRTICTDWLCLLKGNITAPEELITSCPVSCAIPCGAFLQQVIDLFFFLSNVPGLLDVVTKTLLLLEEVVLDYLADYVLVNKVGKVMFQIEMVLLKA
jgi:hypothetical protein